VSYAHKYVEKLAELDQRRDPFVSVTLVEAVGSTPQDVGSKMLVDRSGLVFGTVGGGRVEQKALLLAGELLDARHTQPHVHLVKWNLQRDVGMTCGGEVKLFFEIFNTRRWHVVIFGAGHVAQALVRCLLTLDCHVTCIDQRQEWLDRLPVSPFLQTKQRDEPADEVAELDEHDFVICMTMGHRTDRPILERIFQSGRKFAFLGVIGSRAKRKVLLRELQTAGVAPEVADQFECPIGLPIGNNQPNEIAISVAAQLLQRRDEAATAAS
jgi:xanthine dehydrogenase accessory factor